MSLATILQKKDKRRENGNLNLPNYAIFVVEKNRSGSENSLCGSYILRIIFLPTTNCKTNIRECGQPFARTILRLK
jgi:hypothetical protein